MKMHEISSGEKVILLLHPMLASGKLVKKLIADNLGNYHFFIPDFSGHGEAENEKYISAEKEAEAVIACLKEKGIERIDLAIGASMGAVVLMEMVNKREIPIEKLIFEGASMFSHASLLEMIIKPVMLKKHRKAAVNPEIAVEKMGQLYGDSAKEIMAHSIVNISEESLSNIIHDCSHVNLPTLEEKEERNTVFSYGSADGDLKKAKKLIPKKYPHAKLKVWENYGHCAQITKNTEEYCKFIKEFLES